ncbi:MAG: iron-containing alcohol dehydrogenase [Candidatus Amulumruptor caecigallinarius]|nr:iron-containing alcohol dehydrogenase [Candidatus Amulumruptor caecigallinarius]MCM1397546.1 iron-containing alcohol dehydrogenase [Candidatus Amulumruptor caecigallinarius]MCM1454448.1 iron-containing alcohol dehydrogenase [bacterium]
MIDFTYCSPTRYIFGHDAQLHAGREAAAEGWRKVMLVYGMGSAVRSGLVAAVKASLTDAGIEVVEFGGAQPNPTSPMVYDGIALARKEQVDAMLAVGGGSAIDTAKAIAIGVPYDGDFWDFFIGKTPPVTSLPVATVLTIPAAGSESSGNSVITHTPDNVKLSLRTQCLRPVFSLMNPELTFTLPPFQTACGICDMMAHIFERYFSPTEGVETTDRLAEGLIMAIMTEGPRCLADPKDYDARANIMWAGTQAHNGLCGCGRVEDWVCHFMEHEISALHPSVAHGAGLAVMIPAWMRFMAHRKPAKVAQLGRRVLAVDGGLDDTDAALATAAALSDFFASLGLPVTFAQLGVDAADIPTLVTRLHQNKGPQIGGYAPLTPADTTAIYRLAL